MKKTFRPALLIIFTLLICNCLAAQKHGSKPVVRCATMERVKTLQKGHPQYRTAAPGQSHRSTSISPNTTLRLNGTVSVPVVVHIVLPDPFVVSDADVQAQLNRLNLDFSGLNPDSTNASPAFLAVRGHSNIQFCLAKKTPTGQLTSGIERRSSAAGSMPLLAEDPIKFYSRGGLDAWDASQYLNIWVGMDASNNNILGYAQFPGTGPASQDGVFINIEGWGVSECYTFYNYRKGRTASHEIGHYFGLFHTSGDDGGSCSGDDFRDLSEVGSGCILPAGLYNPPGQGNTIADVGDTPNQGAETTSCPAGQKLDACANTAPGVMYQNFMDYSFDACLTMFTKKQVERMEWILENCRSGLLASNACEAPASAPHNNAAPLETVSPGGYEVNNCNIARYPASILCAGSITPKFRIVNRGLQPLTFVTVGYRIDGGTVVTKDVSLNLQTGQTSIVSFTPVSVGAGNHQIQFFTEYPNHVADEVPLDDTITQTFSVNGSATTPFTEDFAHTIFPPQNWSVINRDGALTWERSEIGNGTPGSAYLNTYTYGAFSAVDDLVSPNISFPAADSLQLTFDVANATFTDIGNPANTGVPIDTLEVLVTKDCGSSFTSVYKKWGADLRTITTPVQDSAFVPTAGMWRKEVVDLTAFTTKSPIQLVFRIISNFENNTYLDNVQVTTKNVPELLKKQGHIILPNPFQNQFSVWHYKQPLALRSVAVYTATGQLVWRKDYNANADKQISVDLTGRSTGLYIVQLQYTDSRGSISEKIIKR